MAEGSLFDGAELRFMRRIHSTPELRSRRWRKNHAPLILRSGTLAAYESSFSLRREHLDSQSFRQKF